MTPPGRARAKRGEGDKTAEAILAAADGLLVGSADEDAVSVRAVADAVGLTPAALYRHYPDKETLLFAVCSQHFDRLDDLAAAAAAGASSPAQALRRIGEAYVRFGVENPEHYRIMFMRRQDHEPEQYAAERVLETGLFGRVMPLVRQATEAGEIRRDLGDELTVAWTLWMAVHGITSVAVAKPNFPSPPLDQQIQATLDVVFAGLAP